MTRPTNDEYIDSSHTEPGESGGIRPAADKHEAECACIFALFIGMFVGCIGFAAILIVWGAL